MTIKTLKTLVLKTVTVSSVKLTTPADRIGLGALVVAAYPAEVLSQGQFPLPPNPEPAPNLGSRQELHAMQTHMPMHAGATAATPAGRAGLLNPGSSACRRHRSFTTTKRATAAGRLAISTGLTTGSVSGLLPATKGRARAHDADHCLPGRIGSDCQSPDRRDDRWSADDRRSRWLLGTWATAAATAAGK